MNDLPREASLSPGLMCHPGGGRLKKIPLAVDEMNAFLSLRLAGNWFLCADSTCNA